MSDLVGRRAFAQALALAPFVAVPAALAQEPAPAEPQPLQPKPPAEPAAEAPRSTGELLLELVQRAEPRKLEPEALAAIRADLERQLIRSRILSRFPLTNADEPGVSFAAWRASANG